MSGAAGLTQTQQRATEKALLTFQRYDYGQNQKSFSSVSGRPQVPPLSPAQGGLQLFTTSFVLSAAVGGVTFFQKLRESKVPRSLSTRLQFSRTSSLMPPPTLTRDTLFSSASSVGKRIGVKQSHVRGIYNGVVTATRMMLDANSEEYFSNEAGMEEISEAFEDSEESNQDFELNIAEFEAADSENYEASLSEDGDEEDMYFSDDGSLDSEGMSGEKDELGDSSENDGVGADADDTQDSDSGDTDIIGQSEEEIRLKKDEMTAKLNAMWSLGEDSTSDYDDFEDDLEPKEQQPVKLRDVLGRYDRVRPISPEDRYQFIEKVPDEVLEETKPLVVFTGEVDEDQAMELSKYLLSMEHGALITRQNYPFVQESEFDEEFRRKVYVAQPGTRARALQQVFTWASERIGNRRAAWAVRAAVSVLFPEDQIKSNQNMEAAFTHGILEGLRVGGDSVFQKIYNNQEEKVWENGAWAEFLYSRQIPQAELMSEEHQSQVNAAIETYYDLYFPKIREKWRNIIHLNMFKNIVTGLLTPGIGTRTTYDNCINNTLKKLRLELDLAVKETKPPQEEATFWLEARSTQIVKELLLRAAQQADPELPSDPSEQMSPWQIMDVALTLARTLLEQYWLLDHPNKQTTGQSSWKGLAKKHMQATAPELTRNLTLFQGYCTYFVQTALMGKRDLSGLGRFDIDVLTALMNLNPVRAKRVVEVAYPAAVAQTIYRQKDKRELTDCMGILDISFGFEQKEARFSRKQVLGTVVTRLRNKNDPQLEDIANWIGDFLKVEQVAEEDQESVLEKMKRENFSRKVAQLLATPAEPSATAEEIKKLIATVFEDDKSKVPETLQPVLSQSLKAMLGAAATCYMRRQVDEGAQALVKVVEYLEQLVVPVLSECGVQDGISVLDAKNLINENEEYNLSELCWELIDSGKEESSVNFVMKMLGMK